MRPRAMPPAARARAARPLPPLSLLLLCAVVAIGAAPAAPLPASASASAAVSPAMMSALFSALSSASSGGATPNPARFEDSSQSQILWSRGGLVTRRSLSHTAPPPLRRLSSLVRTLTRCVRPGKVSAAAGPPSRSPPPTLVSNPQQTLNPLNVSAIPPDLVVQAPPVPVDVIGNNSALTAALQMYDIAQETAYQAVPGLREQFIAFEQSQTGPFNLSAPHARPGPLMWLAAVF